MSREVTDALVLVAWLGREVGSSALGLGLVQLNSVSLLNMSLWVDKVLHPLYFLQSVALTQLSSA